MVSHIAKSDEERSKIVQIIEKIKQDKGYVSIDQACDDYGISRDTFYSYRRALKESAPASPGPANPGVVTVDPEKWARVQEMANKPRTLGVLDAAAPARISVPISPENYARLQKIAARKAMTMAALCADILDKGIQELS